MKGVKQPRGEVSMPRLSDTMQEGTIAQWLKQPGDESKKGDILAEIETDKATMDLEAYEEGTLQQILVQEGETVPIGQALALIGMGAVVQSPVPAAGPMEQVQRQLSRQAHRKQRRISRVRTRRPPESVSWARSKPPHWPVGWPKSIGSTFTRCKGRAPVAALYAMILRICLSNALRLLRPHPRQLPLHRRFLHLLRHRVHHLQRQRSASSLVYKCSSPAG